MPSCEQQYQGEKTGQADHERRIKQGGKTGQHGGDMDQGPPRPRQHADSGETQRRAHSCESLIANRRSFFVFGSHSQ